MTDADLNKAIEVAEEAVAGFADDDSFEQLLALAVLELRKRLNTEREACAKVCEEQYEYYGHDHVFAKAIRARGQE
jgi:hypothetical protein